MAGAVSLQDIATRVGVHKVTVQRALNQDPRVTPETAARIRAAAEALGYVPGLNLTARRLAGLRPGSAAVPSKIIAAIFSSVFFETPYFTRQFAGVLAVLGERGYDLMLRFSDRLAGQELPLPVLRGDVDGLIAICDGDWLRSCIGRLRASPYYGGRPIISLINPIDGACSVSADFRQGGRLATGHLLGLGHRRIIAIAGCAYQAAERLAGCHEECTRYGLDPGRTLTLVEPDMRLGFAGACAEVLDRALALAPDATALMAPNDDIALAMCRLLAQRGRPVPAEMSVVGFDDTRPLPGPDGSNLLTSVALPLEDIGRAAALAAIDPPSGRTALVLPVELHARATSGPRPR